ncbi:ribonuclease H-like domain-containing protein [Tanacetum coccineum]
MGYQISNRNGCGFYDSGEQKMVDLAKKKGTDTAYLLLYVDDIVLTASSKHLLQQLIVGSLNYFLGISVTHDSSGMFLSQRKYATEILEWAHMVSCNSSMNPVDTESKLGDDDDPVSNSTLYQSLTGSL